MQLVNVASSETDVTFELPFDVASTGTLKLLTGNPDDSNTPDAPDYITPETSTISTGSTLNYTASAYSLSVIILSTS